MAVFYGDHGCIGVGARSPLRLKLPDSPPGLPSLTALRDYCEKSALILQATTMEASNQRRGLPGDSQAHTDHHSNIAHAVAHSQLQKH